MEDTLTGCRRYLVTTVLIIVGIFACATATTVALDFACHRDITDWLPMYPDAEVLSLAYNSFRPWAMGRTSAVLWTDAPFVEVNTWYVEQLRAASDQHPDRGIATTNHRLQIDHERGGTRIHLSSECAS